MSTVVRSETRVTQFLEACVRLLPKYYGPDCCIAATRIGCHVLAEFGLDVFPVPVRVILHNAAYAKRVQEGREARNQEDLLRFGFEDGSYTSGLGFSGVQPNGYDGHVVTGIRERGKITLVDPSIGQMNRPQWNVRVLPGSFSLTEDWLGSGEYAAFRNNGCVLFFQSNPAAQEFRTAPDWMLPRYKMVARQILKLM